MEKIQDDIIDAIKLIDEIRVRLDKLESNSDAETDWQDTIGEKLVEAQDSLREANILIEDGADEADEDDAPSEDTPA